MLRSSLISPMLTFLMEEPDIVVDEYVLHKIVNVVDESRTVEQWVTYVVDSEKDCTELDEYYDMKSQTCFTRVEDCSETYYSLEPAALSF
ncbi:hypothetical protein Tco_1130164 [Tanacetum coccineum]